MSPFGARQSFVVADKCAHTRHSAGVHFASANNNICINVGTNSRQCFVPQYGSFARLLSVREQHGPTKTGGRKCQQGKGLSGMAFVCGFFTFHCSLNGDELLSTV